MYITTILYRSMHDFKFGSFHVRSGGAWLEIWGRLKKTGKDTCHARLVYSNGSGRSSEDFSKKENSETEVLGERDRLTRFLNEKI